MQPRVPELNPLSEFQFPDVISKTEHKEILRGPSPKTLFRRRLQAVGNKSILLQPRELRILFGDCVTARLYFGNG